jgi:hypothetical protein
MPSRDMVKGREKRFSKWHRHATGGQLFSSSSAIVRVQMEI